MVGTQKISLPQSMERAMATVAESEKGKEAKIIDAQANLDSAKIYREAADLLGKNDIALQLQYFETLKTLTVSNNSTVVIPEGLINGMRK